MIRIAIIDDQQLFRQGFVILLRQLNYTVSIEASNGKDFIDQVNQQSAPELILLDTQLKDMDSYTLLQWITKQHPTIPVIVLHGKNDFHFLLQLLRAGASSHLAKTASPGEVQRTIQDVVINALRPGH
jgi:DNA-binding NarL/FixJ family response regulator